MKISTWIMAGALALSITGACFAKGYPQSGIWERKVTVETTKASSISTVKTYWKGDKKRTTKYQITGEIVEIKDGSTIYIYSPAQKKAVKAVIPGLTVQQDIAAMVDATKKTKVTKVGTATVAGYRCDIQKVIGLKRGSVRQYVCTDPSFPVVLRTVITDGSSSQTIDTVKLALNANLSDSLFALPKGTKVEVATSKAQKPKGRK